MAFPQFRTWIAERRTEITSELRALEGFQTSRTTFLSQSIARVTDRAVALARNRTDGRSIRPQIEPKVKELLESYLPTGSGPVDDSTKVFLNEALVLLGMSLKTNAGQTARALLKAPLDTLAADIRLGIADVTNLQSILKQIEGENVGQGSSLPADDPRLDGMEVSLAQARDGAERLLVNLSDTSGVNTTLSKRVQSLLDTSLDSLVSGTGNLHRLEAITRSMPDYATHLQEVGSNIYTVSRNLLDFKSKFETSVAKLYSDQAQVTAVLEQLTKFQDTVGEVRSKYPEVASFRGEWVNLLCILQAMTQEARSSAPQAIFMEDTFLRDFYVGLTSALSLIPPTDLSSLEDNITSILSLLLSTVDASMQMEYDLVVRKVQDLLTLYYNRLLALQAVVTAYPLEDSSWLATFQDLVRSSKMTFAEDALAQGDIATFLGLAIGTLNPKDVIQEEVRTFLRGDTTLIRTMGKSLSDSLALVSSFEENDIQASITFEASRNDAITALKEDLINLDKLEAVLDKAEAQGV